MIKKGVKSDEEAIRTEDIAYLFIGGKQAIALSALPNPFDSRWDASLCYDEQA
ncbi:MAG TPA: hypothetical protein V6C82_06085 [Chroococcales cyanobacterium]